MNIATELPAARPANDSSDARLDGGGGDECDWCGRAVRRGTAVDRGDGTEVVLVCPECERGAD
jgi:hypothetical protein